MSSSNRRKTLLASELPSLNDDDNILPDVVDDAAEKRRRASGRFEPRNHHHNKLNRVANDSPNMTTHRGSPNITVAQSATPNIPKPSNEQLSVLYNNCVKLLNENKINAKNAFQLKLIDYMSDIVLNKEIVGGTTNFQMVGCTIDVGTKIYAARVDALHQNTYQMLSGLAQGSSNNAEAGDENQTRGGDERSGNFMVADEYDGDMGDNEEQMNKKARAKKKRVKKSSQICDNLDIITAKIRDDFTDEDFYFAKVSTCIETEAIGGILMNKLHYRDDSGALLINKDDRIDPELCQYDQTPPVEINMKEICDFYKSKGIDFKSSKICSDLSSFKFVGWNADHNNVIFHFFII